MNLISKKNSLTIIEEYRKILNSMIKENASFKEIYKVSVALDELVNLYMK